MTEKEKRVMSSVELQEAMEAAKRMIAAYEGSCLDYIAKDELTVARALLSLSSRVEGMRESAAFTAEFIGCNSPWRQCAHEIARAIRSLPVGEGDR